MQNKQDTAQQKQFGKFCQSLLNLLDKSLNQPESESSRQAIENHLTQLGGNTNKKTLMKLGLKIQLKKMLTEDCWGYKNDQGRPIIDEIMQQIMANDQTTLPVISQLMNEDLEDEDLDNLDELLNPDEDETLLTDFPDTMNEAFWINIANTLNKMIANHKAYRQSRGKNDKSQAILYNALKTFQRSIIPKNKAKLTKDHQFVRSKLLTYLKDFYLKLQSDYQSEIEHKEKKEAASKNYKAQYAQQASKLEAMMGRAIPTKTKNETMEEKEANEEKDYASPYNMAQIITALSEKPPNNQTETNLQDTTQSSEQSTQNAPSKDSLQKAQTKQPEKKEQAKVASEQATDSQMLTTDTVTPTTEKQEISWLQKQAQDELVEIVDDIEKYDVKPKGWRDTLRDFISSIPTPKEIATNLYRQLMVTWFQIKNFFSKKEEKNQKEIAIQHSSPDYSPSSELKNNASLQSDSMASKASPTQHTSHLNKETNQASNKNDQQLDNQHNEDDTPTITPR